MLFKLALRNIRRSVRDYAIYFVTLLVAITVFYAFNSVTDQQVMADIQASGRMNIIDFTDLLMGIFSTVVSIVLGFLVIYANQLLIRRRKREFGTYFLLGMKPGQVSRVVLYETVLVGVVSLALGLGLGILVSQLLSFLTAALYGITLPNYEFTFSMNAFVMTLVCFVAIYVVVAIFNVFTIRRCKLIDLINAESSSQKVIVRNPWLCLVLFIVSIVMLGFAYWHLQENGMSFEVDHHFMTATVLMLVGTLLLFFSLAGFVIGVVTRIRGFYLRKLRPFTTRQVASKINTSFASMWVVSVLLFFAITTFATGMAMVDMFVKDIEAANPYDATVVSFQAIANDSDDPRFDEKFDIDDTEAYLEEHYEGWDEVVEKAASLDLYDLASMKYGDAIEFTGAEVATSGGYINETYIDAVSVSQLNDVLAMQGRPSVTVPEGKYLILNNMAASKQLASEMAQQQFPVETPAGTLLPEKDVMAVQLGNNAMLATGCTLAVNDDVVEAVVNGPEHVKGNLMSYLNVDLYPGADSNEFYERVYDTDAPGISSVLTREEMISQSMGLRLVITYLALYIGLVLLVAVAAVLAVQLLSLTIDSLRRYRTLSRLGCDMPMLGRSIFAQVALYFLAPLIVGACHSAWTIHIMTDTLFAGFGLDLLPTILMSAGFVLLIYGGYLLITYFASRATVRQSLA